MDVGPPRIAFGQIVNGLTDLASIVGNRLRSGSYIVTFSLIRNLIADRKLQSLSPVSVAHFHFESDGASRPA